MTEQSIGPVLDALGLMIDLDDDQQLTEVLVLGKVIDFSTGQASLVISKSDIDWIAQRGLISAAQHVCDHTPFDDDDDDDDD